ncbi:MAG: hypothetical protein ABIG29_02915 [Candidatus Nealsonbacteria bacterium]
MSIFGNKKQIPVKDLIGKAFKGPTEIPGTGGKLYPRTEIVKTLKELLPYQKIGTYLSEIEAKTILRKLRHEEYIAAQSDKKIKAGRLLRLLENEWGLRGKY